jgi:hypothetical protein
VVDHTYTTLKGPVNWRAPETFDLSLKGQIVSAASDVHMLGSCVLEVMTACTRTPFDCVVGRPMGVNALQVWITHKALFDILLYRKRCD